MSKVLLKTLPFLQNKRTLFLRHCVRAGGSFLVDGETQLQEDKSNVKKLLDDAATMDDEVPQNPEDVWSTSPYPKGAFTRNQGLHSFRPRINPCETSILLFPGQGTQYVGMGKDLIRFPAVKDLFESANEILKYDLLKLCTQGPKHQLDRTEYAQPAVLVCSLAALERLKEELPSAIENCVATAGFSLGELTALVFAEALSFEKAVKLVNIRGKLMQLASDMVKGGMITVFYLPDTKLGEVCHKSMEHAKSLGVENPYCAISNYLFPHCKIIAGHEEALNYIEENKDELKLRKIRRLPVSGAFHTPLMAPAVEPFKTALKKVKLSDPMIAVHSNINGKYYRNADHILKQLPKQILAPVKWEQTLHILYERPQDMPFPRTYECGPGQSLTTILKMVNAKAWDNCKSVPA